MKVIPIKAPLVGSADAKVDLDVTGSPIPRERVLHADLRDLPPEFEAAEVVAIARLTTTGSFSRHAVVVRRRRPFIPFGTDPTAVNAECRRTFAIVESNHGDLRFDIIEVTPSAFPYLDDRARRARAYWTPVRIAKATARAKAEILADIATGRVPADVASFAALHDYVDANEYGGLCEESIDPTFVPVNEIQNSLDAWLARGRQDEP